jgi:DNA-binding PucR family transcriptional regulator
LAVSGSNQPNTYAVADVIKLAPVVAVPPRLENPRLVGTTFSASVATQFGLDYVLEYQTSAGDSAWTLAQSVSGNGISRTLTDSSADSTNRFYRVRAQWH